MAGAAGEPGRGRLWAVPGGACVASVRGQKIRCCGPTAATASGAQEGLTLTPRLTPLAPGEVAAPGGRMHVAFSHGTMRFGEATRAPLFLRIRSRRHQRLLAHKHAHREPPATRSDGAAGPAAALLKPLPPGGSLDRRGSPVRRPLTERTATARMSTAATPAQAGGNRRLIPASAAHQPQAKRRRRGSRGLRSEQNLTKGRAQTCRNSHWQLALGHQGSAGMQGVMTMTGTGQRACMGPGPLLWPAGQL